MKASLTHKGLPLGSLNVFTRSYNAMPQAPTDGDAGVPSFGATFESADPAVALSLIDENVKLDMEYQSLEGQVNSVSASSGSSFVVVDGTHIASKLNTTRSVLPIIRNGVGAIENAIYHWAQECGIFRYAPVGNPLVYVAPHDKGNIGWVADTTNRPVHRFTDSFGMPYWGMTNGANYPSIRPLPGDAILIAVHPNAVGARAHFHLAPRNNANETRSWPHMRITLDANKTVKVEEWWHDSASVVKVQGNLSPTGTSATYPIYLLIERVGSSYRYSMTTPRSESNPAPVTVTQTHAESLVATRQLQNVAGDAGKTEAIIVSRANALPTTEQQMQIDVRARLIPFTASNQRFPDVIAGFNDNIWNKIKEASAIYDLDVDFTATGVVIKPREVKDFEANVIPKSAVKLSINSRDYADAVEVVCNELTANKSGGDTLLWESDTSYTLDRGERQEIDIDSGTTFRSLTNPVPKTALPVPYSWSYGAYVVWGADDDVVNPKWWTDNGGYIAVEPMAEAGKFKLILQAPSVNDANAKLQAPYKIAERDFPALKIFGQGVKVKEKTYKIHTGAKKTGTEIGTTFNTPLVSTPAQAYTVGARLAKVYGSSGVTASFNEPFDGEIVRGLNTTYFAYDGNAYRLKTLSQGPKQAQLSADSYNTIAEFGRIHGAKTIAQFNEEYAGKTIKELSLHPFPRFIS